MTPQATIREQADRILDAAIAWLPLEVREAVDLALAGGARPSELLAYLTDPETAERRRLEAYLIRRAEEAEARRGKACPFGG